MADAALRSCPPSLDDQWGPQSILSLLPAAVFVLLALYRGWELRSRDRRVSGAFLPAFKLVIIFVLAALRLTLIVLWKEEFVSRTRVSIPSSAFAFVASVILAPLSFLEHARSIKPSYLICGFLLLTGILDLAQIRTLWLIGVGKKIPDVYSAAFAIGLFLLGLECIHKSRSLVATEDVKRSPEDKHGFISRCFMWWLVPFIYLGSCHTIKMSDLYATPVDASPRTLEHKLKFEWARSRSDSKHRMLKVTAYAIKQRLLAPVIPRLCVVGFTVTQPILLLRLISFIDTHPASPNDGYGLLGAYGLVYLGLAVSRAWYYHQTFKFSTAVRAGLVALIYDKTLRLETSSIDNSSAVTVMSADMERIALGIRSIHDVWANIIQVALAAWLLEREVGVAVVAAVVIALACSYATMKVAGAAGGQQVVWLEKIEKRIDVTMGTLSSMRGIKLSGLAGQVGNVLRQLRVVELDAAARYRWFELGCVALAFFPVMISPVLTFAIYIGAKNTQLYPLDASRVFVTLSWLTLISQPLSMLLQAGPEMFSMVASFSRIGNFMETEERKDSSTSMTTLQKSRTSTEKHYLESKNEEGSLGSDSADRGSKQGIAIENGRFGWKEESPILRNVDLKIPDSKLTVVCGPVGCGKTTLLKAMLGEVPISSGFVDSANNASFCDQSPWIISGTVKHNIVMFSDEDNQLYASVLAACALNDDLRRLPDGDQALVGSNGITLSGGQKQRISVARALFARRDTNLFDDVLSGLDSDTQMHVFSQVFGPGGLLRKRQATTVLVTHAVHFLPFADHIICIGENHDIVQQGTFAELKDVDGYVKDLEIASNRNDVLAADNDQINDHDDLASKAEAVSDKAVQQEKPHGVYRFYIRAIGRWASLFYLIIAVIYAFLFTFPYVWLEWWTRENSTNPGGRDPYYMGIYAMFQVICLISLMILAWHAVITIITSSGNYLHQALVTTVMQAPLSFFESTDTGTTLNRFSQDMQMIDNELPMALLNIFCSGFILIGQLLLIMVVSYWIALSFIGIVAVVWALQVIYLRTSRQLRHLELESKAPLYSLFVESLESLPTIRAFNWSRQCKDLNFERLEASQKPFYLLLCIQRWLSLVLDCMATGFILLIIGLIVGLRDNVSSGFAGVALANMINLSSSLTNLVEVWTEVETSIASIQRIRDFEKDTPSETKGRTLQDPPPSWPSAGAVKIDRLNATYRKGATKALENITMDIKPGEKIGVCGRTGSGKTSLMLSLFQMIEINGGKVEIDGVDIATVHPDRVRSLLNAISQEPYFMPGTVRSNLNPSGDRSDAEISKALESVRLAKVVAEKGGLDAEVKKDTFSHGEKQLFCLARALLKRSKIVVLDEATSNIDMATEKLIHQVITEEFKHFTVITIAHRLETIVDNDRIAVLDAGRVVEFDSPVALLATDSRFRALYETFKDK